MAIRVAPLGQAIDVAKSGYVHSACNRCWQANVLNFHLGTAADTHKWIYDKRIEKLKPAEKAINIFPFPNFSIFKHSNFPLVWCFSAVGLQCGNDHNNYDDIIIIILWLLMHTTLNKHNRHGSQLNIFLFHELFSQPFQGVSANGVGLRFGSRFSYIYICTQIRGEKTNR